ncbi:hypothetical protein [Pleionea sp. CnH1-48]|uniref:hypothetical protein n=1 Tax=Pleionea sp. CnH1-48 TaxID=2954494 RepID=UPI0020977970|nr:hypothetical protein [Pleionea sp. CnH1-48]MCO7224949.1 hypothetical protein [Pleionea sp. CnH1-48]
MDKKYIEDNIAEKYLRGQLTAEESAEFEAYFMDKPELLEQLELDRIMYQAMPSAELASKKEQGLRWFDGLFLKALVAPLLVGAVGLQLLVVSQENKEPELIVNEPKFFVDTMRSSNISNEQHISITLKDSTPYFKLIITPYAYNQKHTVNIIDSTSSSLIVRAEDILPNDEGVISLLLKSDIFESQDYTLEISSEDNKREVRVSLIR